MSFYKIGTHRKETIEISVLTNTKYLINNAKVRYDV